MNGKTYEKSNRKKRGILKTLIIVATVVGALIYIVPKLLLLLFIYVFAPDLNDVSRNINVLSVAGSYGNTGEYVSRLVVSNGDDTYIYQEGCICKYIDDDNAVPIAEAVEGRIYHMAINDKYLLYNTYDQIFRYDLATGEEILLLDDISVDQIMVVDNVFFVQTDKSDALGVSKDYNYLIAFEGDDTHGERLSLDADYESYGEKHIEDIPMYKTSYKDYTIYIGDMPWKERAVIAIEKDSILYPFRDEAVFMIDGHMVTLDEGQYMYEGKLYDIKSTKEEHIRHYACMSCLYNDEIYILTREGHGYTALYPNPIAVKEEYILKISPDKGRDEILYKADEKSRIAGFDIEAGKIYLIDKKDVISMQDIETQKREKITCIPDLHMTLYFEWCNDRLFIFGYDGDYKLLGSYDN